MKYIIFFACIFSCRTPNYEGNPFYFQQTINKYDSIGLKQGYWIVKLDSRLQLTQDEEDNFIYLEKIPYRNDERIFSQNELRKIYKNPNNRLTFNSSDSVLILNNFIQGDVMVTDVKNGEPRYKINYSDGILRSIEYIENRKSIFSVEYINENKLGSRSICKYFKDSTEVIIEYYDYKHWKILEKRKFSPLVPIYQSVH